MRIGCGLFKQASTTQENITSIVKALSVGKKHQCELILFGKGFLNQPLPLDSVGLFQLKQACVCFDINLGIGLINDINESTYLFINQEGEIKESLMIDDHQFYLPDENEAGDVLIYPMNHVYTEKEWMNVGLNDIRKKLNHLSSESIIINLFNETSLGGCVHLKDNQLLVNQPLNQEGLSIIEIV